MTAEALVAEGFAAHRAGRLDVAERLYRAALAAAPDELNALQLLGALAADAGRASEAVPLLERAQSIVVERGGATAQHAALYGNLGGACRALGRMRDAERHYREGLLLDPMLPELHAGLAATLAECGDYEGAAAAYETGLRLRPGHAPWRHALAVTLVLAGTRHQGEGRTDQAETAYRAALALEPALPEALYALGMLLFAEREDAAAAVALFERLRAVAPDHADIDAALGSAYRGLGRTTDAVVAFRRAAARAPHSPLAHVLLGRALGETEAKREAVATLERAFALGPDRALAHLAYIDLGNALQDLDEPEEARAAFKAAVALEPLVTRKAAKPKPDFAALLVLAPGALNTPHDYLVSRAPFESHVLLLLPETAYDVVRLRARCDVVVNLVSDADRSKAILPLAGALIDRIGKPVINHPARIAPTDRESMAALLGGIPHCRVPRTLRVPGAVLAAGGARADLPLPFLARLAGRHGGDAFARFECWDDLEALAASHAGEDFYLIEYLDYRSSDGLFRKYRFFCVGPQILPYHLAIGRAWKLHHFRTDMAHEPVLQREEKAFLDAPESVFAPRHFEALRAIKTAVGLEFFGIDCGLDRDGNLVLFEANATMLVHDRNPDAAYKSPAARRIKAAFGELLAAAARAQSRASAA